MYKDIKYISYKETGMRILYKNIAQEVIETSLRNIKFNK